MAAGLKPSLISHNHKILTKDGADFMCSCFRVFVRFQEEQSLGHDHWVESHPVWGVHCFSSHFWGSQSMERWSGSTLSSSVRVPGFSKCVRVCVCVVLVCVCTNECVCSIGCSWVAKQPCVCTLEWGWEEREAPGQQRQTLTGIAASDWTHRCSWWMMPIIIMFTGCRQESCWSLKVHLFASETVAQIPLLFSQYEGERRERWGITVWYWLNWFPIYIYKNVLSHRDFRHFYLLSLICDQLWWQNIWFSKTERRQLHLVSQDGYKNWFMSYIWKKLYLP